MTTRLLSPELCQEYALDAEILRREIERHKELFPHSTFQEAISSKRIKEHRASMVLFLTQHGIPDADAIDTVKRELMKGMLAWR